ncbi:hypothetical protein SAMN05421810_10851 [Amycolatopsis arida]|uniref:DoxX-like family protein n=1 Tax=Amycolatopsis arida TaxID=587909 RepID=A0A1I5YXR5_9PSEU|nr:hypothetical protein [Amycolatopsis arida]TDX89964.1 hypothetical protein CLV69_10851 [Amycolatopsis arida]SFQ49031.1 hypothetical protein SAMN05421810_10851 [Amycolatopsis arida]
MAGKAAKTAGLLVAATGAAHFAAPQLFENLSASLFPEDTRSWVYRNGATEVALGAAIVGRRTRKLGVVGLLAYGGWLASRAAAQR